MAHPNQVDAHVICTDCYYLSDEEWADNSDRMKIMTNGIVTCRNCHAGLGGVEPDGSIEWFDEGVFLFEED